MPIEIQSSLGERTASAPINALAERGAKGLCAKGRSYLPCSAALRAIRAPRKPVPQHGVPCSPMTCEADRIRYGKTNAAGLKNGDR